MATICFSSLTYCNKYSLRDLISEKLKCYIATIAKDEISYASGSSLCEHSVSFFLLFHIASIKKVKAPRNIYVFTRKLSKKIKLMDILFLTFIFFCQGNPLATYLIVLNLKNIFKNIRILTYQIATSLVSYPAI